MTIKFLYCNHLFIERIATGPVSGSFYAKVASTIQECFNPPLGSHPEIFTVYCDHVLLENDYLQHILFQLLQDYNEQTAGVFHSDTDYSNIVNTTH